MLVFDERLARKGYKLNRMLYELRQPERRAALLRDEETFYRAYGLSEREIELLRTRDWPGLLEAGANIYTLEKFSRVVGDNLFKMGAQMRGEPYAAFMARKGARH
jgi:hypothetical protein